MIYLASPLLEMDKAVEEVSALVQFYVAVMFLGYKDSAVHRMERPTRRNEAAT